MYLEKRKKKKIKREEIEEAGTHGGDASVWITINWIYSCWTAVHKQGYHDTCVYIHETMTKACLRIIYCRAAGLLYRYMSVHETLTNSDLGMIYCRAAGLIYRYISRDTTIQMCIDETMTKSSSYIIAVQKQGYHNT